MTLISMEIYENHKIQMQIPRNTDHEVCMYYYQVCNVRIRMMRLNFNKLYPRWCILV